jgi:hypothetical protein
MKKKLYMKPQQQVILLKHTTPLLAGSPEPWGSPNQNDPYYFE